MLNASSGESATDRESSPGNDGWVVRAVYTQDRATTDTDRASVVSAAG